MPTCIVLVDSTIASTPMCVSLHVVFDPAADRLLENAIRKTHVGRRRTYDDQLERRRLLLCVPKGSNLSAIHDSAA